ncbi:MAG: response regulator transcription factor [Clostridiaceae bacterium]|nr:response regulator transcription factor [Clostridiaceae bacterium]
MDYSYRLLAVDDEVDILRTNRRYLEARGYQVDSAVTASEALELLKRYTYDCILLDVLLPDMNGFKLCEAIRNLTTAPILFLSCMDDEEDKINGLMAGGDDYITKPYSLKELAARVHAQVRRSSMKGFAIDYQNQFLRVDNRIIPLAQKEFDLFLFLLGNPGRILSAAELYQKVWCTGKIDSANTVAVHITRLRHKLEEIEPVIGRIDTIRGEGYRFIPKSEAGIKL